MLLWGLAVLHQLTPELWASLLRVVAQTPPEQLDEVCSPCRWNHASQLCQVC